MKKNIAGQRYKVIAFDASGRVTGDAANITCQLAIDGGALTPLTDVNPVEVGTTGEYIFDLTQAETNGYELSFTPASATPGVNILGVPANVIYTLDVSAPLGCSDGSVPVFGTITDGSSNPIADLQIRATTDSNGENIVNYDITDDFGYYHMMLDPGTYWLFFKKAGFQRDPEQITVS